MESEYPKDNGTDKEEIIHEEKAVCNKFDTYQIFGGGIGILKNREWEDRNIHAFVVV